MQDGGGVLSRLRSAVPPNSQAAADALLAADLAALPGLLESLATQLKVPEVEEENFWDVDAPRVGGGEIPRTSALDPWSAVFCLAVLAPLPVVQLVEQELKKHNVDLLGLVDQEGNSALNIAILANKLDSVRYLANSFPNLCLRHNWRKELPLQLAVREGSPEILQEILTCAHAKAGTRVDEHGNTVLMSAIEQGKIELVDFLLEKTPSGKAALSKCNHDGESPLMLAASRGSLPLVQLLLSHGSAVSLQDDSANTVVHHAVLSGNAEVVRCLAQQEGVRINETNDDEETALHLAPMVSRSADVLICLLEAGADPTVPDSEGCTVFHRAIRAHNMDCVKAICERGCDLEVCSQAGLTPLLTAAKYASYEMVQYLMERGADCAALDSHNQTALHLALVNPGPMALELARSSRFPLEQQDSDGMTPFLLAARYGDLETVEYLAETALVDTEARDKEGDSALAMAVVGNRMDLLPYLLSIISCQVRNSSGQTPVILAARYSPPEVLQCLIEAEADVSVRDSQGCDCVMSAVLGGNLPCLQVLISHRCGVTAINNEGETALLLGLRANDESIIDALMQIPERHATMLHVLPQNVIRAVVARNRSIRKCPPGKQGDRRRQELYETRDELLEAWDLPDVVVAKVCCWNSRKLGRRARQDRINLKPNPEEEDNS